MKQQITMKQWNELSDKEKNKYYKATTKQIPYRDRYAHIIIESATIGQLIEYLGEDLMRYDKGNSNGKTAYALLTKDGKQITAFELIDALWEAVKYKLRKV